MEDWRSPGLGRSLLSILCAAAGLPPCAPPLFCTPQPAYRPALHRRSARRCRHAPGPPSQSRHRWLAPALLDPPPQSLLETGEAEPPRSLLEIGEAEPARDQSHRTPPPRVRRRPRLLALSLARSPLLLALTQSRPARSMLGGWRLGFVSWVGVGVRTDY